MPYLHLEVYATKVLIVCCVWCRIPRRGLFYSSSSMLCVIARTTTQGSTPKYSPLRMV